MADARFCVGFSKACKQAREGGGLPESQVTSRGLCLRPFLPPDIIRLIDALVRRLEHEDTLLAMNGGVLGATLCEAAKAGGLRDVRFLLQRGAALERTSVRLNKHGKKLRWPALTWSAVGGHLEVVAELLARGAGNRDRALRSTAFQGHTPVMRLLLDGGADVHSQQDSALCSASQEGRTETVALLLDRGADIHALENKPLRLAAKNRRLETVRLLLDRGADLHADNDMTLVFAAGSGELEVTAFLLDRGADMHALNGRALHFTALRGQLEAVRLLLDRGADIHAGNDFALRVAREEGHENVIALLLERGAVG